jgi:diaminohydroxyphosphoribosylaminopyrimidine deaminase/5-amino-6-(5-phosphoribosylamino)uracil reductase
MLQALALAKVKRGFCAPNPSVGAVVVKDGKVIAEGYHLGPGCPHAEVAAIEKLGHEACGTDLFVTLEPCCHRNKRTPPCTDLIIQTGIKRVYYAVQDPNPEVSGQGALLLRDKGISCEQVNAPAVQEFYKSYQHWWQHRRPWVTYKLAFSLDGKIAGKNGTPIALTGAATNEYTHNWRKQSDAILTTAQTILRDNPALNVRLGEEKITKPVYVLDRLLQVPMSAQVFQTARNVTLFYDAQIAEKTLPPLSEKVRYFPIESQNGLLNLAVVLDQIGQDGMHDLWVEAGIKCAESFMQQKLAKRWIFYIAPQIVGKNGYGCVNEIFDFSEEKVQWSQCGTDGICIVDSFSDLNQNCLR